MSRTRTSTVQCPRCGRPLEFTPHPTKASRIIADCECNRGPLGEYLGPVVEMNAENTVPAFAGMTRDQEVVNDSPIS